jgi:hypothetical protein
MRVVQRGFCAALVPLAVGAAFWVPALRAARGFFPAPLDDVYIHFDFARSFAEGHPFEWIPGNGYSSGETSPLYAVLLAIGWLVGFRGRLVGVFGAMLAIAALSMLAASVQKLARSASTPRWTWLTWIIAAVPLSIPLVDWSLYSGMEVAVLAGAIGCALVALDRTRHRAGITREASQWRLGAWGAALVLLRPEAVVLVAVFAIIAARGAAARSGFAALVRAALPGAIAVSLVLGANALATGDAASAGARLKLLSSNPYLSDVDRARAFVENLVTFAIRGVGSEVPLLVLLLASAALVPARTRAVAAACLLGALAWTLLVSWNGNSPHHNFRYYAPAIMLVAVAAALGIAGIARMRFGRGRWDGAAACLLGALAWTLLVSWNGNSPHHDFRYYTPAIMLVVVAAALGIAGVARVRVGRGRWAAAAVALATIALAAPRFPTQVSHFRRAVANVRDQQLEVGVRLAAATPPDARVLLGDAGAIPFVSGRNAIDALGLGGFKRMPFARAAVHGEAATIELIERLAPEERPTHFALYPNWFTSLTGRFGVEVDRVTITDNLICGGATKAIYRADWTALDTAPRDDVDEIDIADVVSESDHAYAPPTPRGGWTTLDVLADASGTRRFDGGRVIPAGASESFVVKRSTKGIVRVRTDGSARAIAVSVRGNERAMDLASAREGSWRDATAAIDVHAGDVITLRAPDGEYRDYHVWLEPAQSPREATR